MNTPEEDQIWTCAMHPQIRQNEPGLCPICEMDLTPLEKNTSENPMVLEMTEEAINLANIQTSTVGLQTKDSKTLYLSGKIKTDERRISSQTAHIPGRIEKLFVTFTGEKVTKGQVIASIYSPEFVAAQQELIEAKKLKSTNPNLLEAARKKLAYWKISKSVIDSIEKSEIVNTLIDIHADATGFVNNLQIAVGQHIMEGDVLFDVIDLNQLWVIFDAYEEDLSQIHTGNKISFSVPALGDKTFTTRVSYIDPVIDQNTRTASVRSEVNNSKGLLKPEMFVKGTLINTKKSNNKDQLSIPKTALLWTGKRSVVYVKVPGIDIPSFEYREVEIGETLGDYYEILSGLKAGEEVVTNGSFTIDAAAQLNNQNSMMNKRVNVRKQIETDEKINSPSKKPLPQKVENDLKKHLNYYLKIKEALVDSDSVSAAKFAKELVGFNQKFRFNELEKSKEDEWLKLLSSFFEHARNISKTMNLEKQRAEFYLLSNDLIELLKMSKEINDPLYVQHCPMANNDQGADWISLEKEVKNPYYGDKMLKCGFVKDKIDKR